LHFVFPIQRIICPPWNNIGIALIAIGIILNIWADQLFKKRNTTVKPNEVPVFLVQEGPFRFSRHPMYLGMVIVLLGTVVILGSVSPFACVVIFFMTMGTFFVPCEEKTNVSYLNDERYV